MSRAKSALVSTKQGPKLHIVQVPNDTLTTWFVNTLEIQDVRYDITYYGPFLRDLPRRLGSSPVLDAAATARVSSCPYFQKQDVPPAILAKFGKALRTLRECLDDPVDAQSPNTLCAIYLISTCQSWVGTSQKQRSSHAEAIAHIFNIIDLKEYRSGFARHLLITLCVLVSRYQAAFTVVSSLALLLNTLLHSFHQFNPLLAKDPAFFVQQIIEGADLASRDRPLGAAYVPLCLIVALAATKELQQVARVEATLEDYQSDFKTLDWRNCARWLKTLLENHRLGGKHYGTGFDVDTSE
ncbi:Cytochrome P450 [Penicillium sp. IBT 35674x]|nr:Cytochrome P450 [Penicillium sp. IBT 35674x]